MTQTTDDIVADLVTRVDRLETQMQRYRQYLERLRDSFEDPIEIAKTWRPDARPERDQ